MKVDTYVEFAKKGTGRGIGRIVATSANGSVMLWEYQGFKGYTNAGWFDGENVSPLVPIGHEIEYSTGNGKFALGFVAGYEISADGTEVSYLVRQGYNVGLRVPTYSHVVSLTAILDYLNNGVGRTTTEVREHLGLEPTFGNEQRIFTILSLLKSAGRVWQPLFYDLKEPNIWQINR